MIYDKSDIQDTIINKVQSITGISILQESDIQNNINNIMSSIDMVQLIIELENLYNIVFDECYFKNLSVERLANITYKKVNNIF